ncbi:MAG: 50S ribosomal protein L24 [Flavobacteriales bacterium]|nr:50S ribosomal protein L24 [Flavobacteriales bacterium]
MKVHIKKGDKVVVTAGEHKGMQGNVLSVDAAKSRATVEGVNLASHHTKPSAQNPNGGIIKKEAPLHISKLKVVDSDGKPTRVGRTTDEKTGKSVRISVKAKKEGKTLIIK